MRFPWPTLLAAVLGCGAGRSSSARHGQSDTGWREYGSDHFVVATDADRDDVRTSLAEFETSYDALRAVLFSGDPYASSPAHVVLFSHQSDLQRFIPSSFAAAFFSGIPGDPQNPPTVLMETSFTDAARRIFLHEMTHAFIRRSFGEVPLWLNEGLAEYFETMRIESGRVVLGDPIAAFSISANQLPTLQAILDADASVFYAGSEAHSVDDTYRQTAYYTGAWNLVHLLMHGSDDYRARFQDYLAALKRREPAKTAWSRAFDEGTAKRLAHDYLEYLRADSLSAGFVAIDVRNADKVAFEERVMTQTELQALWNRLQRAGARR